MLRALCGLIAVVFWVTPIVSAQTPTCDTPAPSTLEAPADTVVVVSFLQPVTKRADGSIVPVDGFTINWNGNLLDLTIGSVPAAFVAAPVGAPCADGRQEYRTTLFFGSGTHKLSIVAWSNGPTGRLVSSPPTEFTVIAGVPPPPPPPPVDCVVSAWSEWSAWVPISATQEQRTRTRTILTQPANGGAACPALVESETRDIIPPPPPPLEVCGNGIDDNQDGQIDEGCPPPQNDPCRALPPTLKVYAWPTFGRRTKPDFDARSPRVGTKMRVYFSFDGTRAVSATLEELEGAKCSITVIR